MSNDELLEAMARAMAATSGEDPDELITYDGETSAPMWVDELPAARAALPVVERALLQQMRQHTVERYDPYDLPAYAGIRVDGAFVFNDAIPDEDLHLQISRARAVLDFRAAERATTMSEERP